MSNTTVHTCHTKPHTRLVNPVEAILQRVLAVAFDEDYGVSERIVKGQGRGRVAHQKYGVSLGVGLEAHVDGLVEKVLRRGRKSPVRFRIGHWVAR